MSPKSGTAAPYFSSHVYCGWPKGRPSQLLLNCTCCTAHGGVSSEVLGHALPHNSAPFPWGNKAPFNTLFLGPIPEFRTQTAFRSVQPFCRVHGTASPYVTMLYGSWGMDAPVATNGCQL